MTHKIKINHWEQTCEDDSCFEYGTSVSVNGKELVREASIVSALEAVLKEQKCQKIYSAMPTKNKTKSLVY